MKTFSAPSTMTGLAWLHGWGLAADSLAGLAATFPGRPSVLLEAGYFGKPDLGLPDNPDGWIGIGHSLGFAALASLRQDWRGLIGLNAFAWFCRSADRPAGTDPAIVRAMLERLADDPADVLRRFRRRCGFAPGPIPALDGPGLERLTADLGLLLDLDIRPALDRLACPMLVLAADDDRIVGLKLTEHGFAGREAVTLARFADGGHALPATRSADCVAAVKEFLRARA